VERAWDATGLVFTCGEKHGCVASMGPLRRAPADSNLFKSQRG